VELGLSHHRIGVWEVWWGWGLPDLAAGAAEDGGGRSGGENGRGGVRRKERGGRRVSVRGGERSSDSMVEATGDERGGQ
jgi:hypothetical protein